MTGVQTCALPISVTLPTVDVTDATETITQSVLLNEILPQGVMLGNDTPLEAEVSVVIQQQEEQQQQITVQSALITLEGEEENYEYTLSENSVSLQLTGTARALAMITTGSIPVKANVTDLSIGEQNVPLEINLPQDVTLVGEMPSVTVTIIEKEKPAEQPEESEQQEETEQPEQSEQTDEQEQTEQDQLVMNIQSPPTAEE